MNYDGNAVAERLHGARAAEREREIDLYRADAREDLVARLLKGERIGRGWLAIGLVEILTEWPGVEVSEPAQRIVAAINAPGDGDAQIGDLALWLRRVAEQYLDAHDERIDERAEEMCEAAREDYAAARRGEEMRP